MGLNFFGPVALTKQVLPSMISRGEGHIVVVSSLLGKFATPNRAAYSASKHALHGFFDALRAEIHAEGIAVTMICPGFIRTYASFNALEGDGTRHNKMDREIDKGLPSDECARRVLRAIERRKREVYIGRKERLGVYICRFAPGLFHRLIRRRSKAKSRKGKHGSQ
jgi:short-subunit dehydrogenase